MTEQEAYERMREWLGREGASKSESRNGLCVYRLGDGNKCAVGVLIPDEEYHETFENATIDSVAEACPSLEGLDLGFLSQAQNCHDHTPDNEEFSVVAVGKLDRLAEEWGLEVVGS